MTKDKLLAKCKVYVDKGEFSKMQRCLMSHPKLLITYYNELQTELTEYARSKEVSEEDKEKLGGN